MKGPYFIGIDVGTQGARVVLMDAAGNLIGTEEQPFPLTETSTQEQSPEGWWAACFSSLKKLLNDAAKKIDSSAIKAIAVTSTSGTVIPLDANNQSLHPGIMYSDKRSDAEGKRCREVTLKNNVQGFTAFNSSCGLAKMVWFANAHPDKASRIAKWIHAADYLTGKLTNRWGITDHSNALKSGYDLHNNKWPDYIAEELGIKKEWLPEVVPSGQPIARVDAALAKELRLPLTVQVVAGMTDGCASQIASGAVSLGDWNTTIGTTLVLKGVTAKEIVDPEGRLYNHRHPDGWWMPGGASNIGADWISKEFKQDVASLNVQAASLIPTGHIAYPLRQKGERFPFIAPTAEGFAPSGLSRAELFTAYLEGVAFVERYAYEMVQELSGEKASAVYTAGGGSNSDAWLTIRSSVLGLPIYKMKHGSGAVGAAILAASQTHFSSLAEAAKAMTQAEKEVLPQKDLRDAYGEQYKRFLQTMEEKGYIKTAQYA